MAGSTPTWTWKRIGPATICSPGRAPSSRSRPKSDSAIRRSSVTSSRGRSRIASSPPRRDADVEDIAGPRALTRLLYELPATQRGAVRVLPQIHWMAPWEYPRIGPLARLIHARHATSGTWRSAAEAKRPWRERLTARNRLPNPFSDDGPVLA